MKHAQKAVKARGQIMTDIRVALELLIICIITQCIFARALR